LLISTSHLWSKRNTTERIDESLKTTDDPNMQNLEDAMDAEIVPKPASQDNLDTSPEN
jgi:hypothetical protein